MVLQFMSSFRGSKALFMQLLRSNISPEQRPEVFKALVCIAYLVSLLSLTFTFKSACEEQCYMHGQC